LSRTNLKSLCGFETTVHSWKLSDQKRSCKLSRTNLKSLCGFETTLQIVTKPSQIVMWSRSVGSRFNYCIRTVHVRYVQCRLDHCCADRYQIQNDSCFIFFLLSLMMTYAELYCDKLTRHCWIEWITKWVGAGIDGGTKMTSTKADTIGSWAIIHTYGKKTIASSGLARTGVWVETLTGGSCE